MSDNLNQDPQHLLHNDPDWINSEKYGYSLDALTEKHPEGAPDRLIASCLMIPRDEVEPLYNDILLQLREIMGILPESESDEHNE